ncbi:MAG: hypothetical protein NVSMB9_18060 [Isosphaeraceae bacterium]
MREPLVKQRLSRFALRVPWGLIGMIALVALGERFVARGAMDFLSPDDWSYRRSVQASARQAGRHDVLCFGESLVKVGVLPEGVRERTGWSTYNLAVPGSQATSSYFLLRRALGAGAKPKALVVDFVPSLLGVGPRHNLKRWASLLSITEAAELAWWASDAELFARVAIDCVLPSVRARAGLRTNIVNALKGRANEWHYANFFYFRNGFRNNGAYLLPPNVAIRKLTAETVAEVERGFLPYENCHAVNARGIEEFLALAAAHDLPVYWVLPPLLPVLNERLASRGFDADQRMFVRSFQARYPNVVVVDGQRGFSDPEAFHDAIHLAARGAYAFSLALGDVLRRTCPDARVGKTDPAERWVTVSTCPLVPVPEGTEDTDQSQLALHAIATRRR